MLHSILSLYHDMKIIVTYTIKHIKLAEQTTC